MSGAFDRRRRPLLVLLADTGQQAADNSVFVGQHRPQGLDIFVVGLCLLRAENTGLSASSDFLFDRLGHIFKKEYRRRLLQPLTSSSSPQSGGRVSRQQK